MLVKNFAGGVVFSEDKVLLLKNEKDEWVLPKGMMHQGELSDEVALKKVREEAGVQAEIVSSVGQINYELSSITRQRPFYNKITWYIMKSLNENNMINESRPSVCGGFFKVEEAMSLINDNKDKSLLNLYFRKYKELAQ